MKRLVSILLMCAVAMSTITAQVNKAQKRVRGKADIVSHVVSHAKPVKSIDNGSKDVISTFPYIQDFENGLNGWTVNDADGDNMNWTVVALDGYTHSGNSCIMSESYSEANDDALTPDNWLVSPAIQLPAADSMSLLWYVMPITPMYPAENYTVYITTGDGDIASFTTAATGSILFSETLDSNMTEYQSREVSLAAYAGQTVHVAFRHHNCIDEYALLLDDITIMKTGAPVVTIQAMNATYIGNPVQLYANMIYGDTANLTYAWSITGATPATAITSQVNATWNTAGLYLVRLTARNNIGSCTDSMLIRVYDCGDSITTFPYMEDFEYGIGCWQVIDADNDGNDWQIGETAGNAHNGNGYLVSQSYSDDEGALTPDNWIVSPAIRLPNDALELSWFVRPESEFYPEENYSVYVSTTGATVADFTTQLFTETLTSFTDYQRRIVSLSAYAGQTIRIAFRHHDCEDQWAVNIDDVTIGQPGAPMVAIRGPRSVRTCDSTVAFSAEVTSTLPISSFNWSIAPAGVTLVSGATDSSALFNVSQASTGTYTVTFVATNANGSDTATAALRVLECNGGLVAPFTETFADGLGCWGAIDADGDGHNWESLAETFERLEMDGIEEYCYSDSNAIVSWSYYPTDMSFFGIVGDSLNCTDILVSPAVQLAAGQAWKLTFYARSFADVYPDGLEVKIATSAPRQLSDFTVALMPRTVLSDSVYRQFVYDISAYAGQSIYLGFIHQDNNQYGLLLDDVSVMGQVTGIDGVAEDNVMLFPNPTDGRLSVQADGLRQVEVLDMNGRRVALSADGHVNLSALGSGIYLVRVTTTDGVSVHKIVKK